MVVTGGVGPFNYSWNLSGESTAIAVNLIAGFHTVTVTDTGNGDLTTQCSISILEPASALSVSYTQTDVNCDSPTIGAIDLTVSGGTSDYTFAWTTSDGSGLVATDEDQNWVDFRHL